MSAPPGLQLRVLAAAKRLLISPVDELGAAQHRLAIVDELLNAVLEADRQREVLAHEIMLLDVHASRKPTWRPPPAVA